MSGTLSIPFEIGKPVWICGHLPEQRQVTCPECLGTLRVTMTLGNGESHKLPCAHCSIGFGGPSGYITVDTGVFEPKKFIPARVTGINSDGTVDYTDSLAGYNIYSIVSSAGMFITREECQEVCDAKTEEHRKSVAESELARLASKRKSLAFSVSYWRSQRAKTIKQLALIESQISEIKAK